MCVRPLSTQYSVSRVSTFVNCRSADFVMMLTMSASEILFVSKSRVVKANEAFSEVTDLCTASKLEDFEALIFVSCDFHDFADIHIVDLVARVQAIDIELPYHSLEWLALGCVV